jgi:hypothetical protein
MTMTLEGCWQANGPKFIRSVMNRHPALSSKGVIQCPSATCTGTIQWARDFVGYYYLQCDGCQYDRASSKAS